MHLYKGEKENNGKEKVLIGWNSGGQGREGNKREITNTEDLLKESYENLQQKLPKTYM